MLFSAIRQLRHSPGGGGRRLMTMGARSGTRTPPSTRSCDSHDMVPASTCRTIEVPEKMRPERVTPRALSTHRLSPCVQRASLYPPSESNVQDLICCDC